MKIKCAYSKLEELHKIVPNPKNTNVHPDKQIDLLTKIIDFQGQRSPIVISKRSGFVVKGHGRLLAIQRLGWEKAAVDYQDYDSEAQEYADLEADNRIAELSHRDEDKFKEQANEILGLDFDLELLGIGDGLDFDGWKSDIDDISKTDKNTDGIDAVIKITCPQDLKDEVLIYIKAKLLETSFEGVHVK